MPQPATRKPRPKQPPQAAAQSPGFLVEARVEALHLGERLREIRSQQGLSIRALAEMSGLNVNTLSMIENGHTSPTVSTLQRLAQSLRTPIVALFESSAEQPQVIFQRDGARPCARFAHGSMEDFGAGQPPSGVEPRLVTLDPHAEGSSHPLVHTGSELVYALAGRIAMTVGSETYTLAPGDSLFFAAYLPHYWKNMDATLARFLLFLCPADSRDRPGQASFFSLMIPGGATTRLAQAWNLIGCVTRRG